MAKNLKNCSWKILRQKNLGQRKNLKNCSSKILRPKKSMPEKRILKNCMIIIWGCGKLPIMSVLVTLVVVTPPPMSLPCLCCGGRKSNTKQNNFMILQSGLDKDISLALKNEIFFSIGFLVFPFFQPQFWGWDHEIF